MQSFSHLPVSSPIMEPGLHIHIFTSPSRSICSIPPKNIPNSSTPANPPNPHNNQLLPPSDLPTPPHNLRIPAPSPFPPPHPLHHLLRPILRTQQDERHPAPTQHPRHLPQQAVRGFHPIGRAHV